ncbi:unnamed protein product, partial [marine sediment metagenome]
STRMKSALPKAVHPVCGKPMTRHVIDACLDAGIREIVVVIGHGADEVRPALGDEVVYAHQTEQLGTGHACMQALPQVSDNATDVLVLPGDTPLITADDISKLVQSHAAEGNVCTLLTAMLDDASHYGRVIRDAQEAVLKVLEAKDADKEALAIREINTSIYCFDKRALAENLSLVKTDNVQKEYYLTDVIELLSSSDNRVGAVVADDPADTLGINNRAELAAASDIMRRRSLFELRGCIRAVLRVKP